MGKFHLQKAKMTFLSKKVGLEFVNFLKRGFVWVVNLTVFWKGWKVLFKIVFLDNSRALCYYIIYIWENSAQNGPIGGVCLTRCLECILAEPLPRVRKWAAAPDRDGDLRALKREQTKTISGQKSC